MLYHRGAFNPVLAPPSFPNYATKSLPFPKAWMQTRFAFEMFRERPDKLFLPIQAAPFFLPRSIEVTATIHDLAFKRYPETFPPYLRLKLNVLLDAVVRRADKLIAVSASTKRDLLEYFPHLSEDKIKVIHHGFDADFFGTRISSEELNVELMKRVKLKAGSYLLYVGALQPRKNLVRLIRAFEIAKRHHSEMRLVLAGEPAWLSESIIEAREQSPFKNDIILTGRVSFEELRALYQGARLFVFPSLYEGFGIPVLEAFASGLPVLTADNSSLREVGGDAALYCDAGSEPDIAEKLEQLWQDAALRETLIEKGRERLQQFSWDKCAQATIEYILR